jgi:hypothetical protein
MTTGVCPELCLVCGYPTFGADLCYFCEPVGAKTLAPFPSSLVGPTDTPEKTSVIAADPGRCDANRSSVTELRLEKVGRFTRVMTEGYSDDLPGEGMTLTSFRTT